MGNDLARQIAASARNFEDPAERAEYLDRVCQGIARLRADVESHLAAMEAGTAAEPAEREEPQPARAPAPVPPETASDPTSAASSAADVGNEKAGDRIGRYVLVKELGEGGFGTVWKAQQVEPVKREVALKIIKLGMDTEQVVARFEQERQALALMDHPNVARVLDAGATARGRPYFVMDLVQGVPIGEFCDAERLTVEARLGLFAQVCAAVQHAHMKGIIHRDLKPSNILVARRDGKPHATVIDFGIAKATSSKLTDRSLVTEAYQVIGTLQYMSPEQSQASPDIDTRTDVYSLGVILYELLTGTTPYDSDTFRRAVLSDILRMIGEVDPPPPSAKVTQARDALPAVAESRSVDVRRLSTVLRGDLDWIVLKAIEKDRARRYESAEAFAADLRRYVAGEPVTAAPPSASYRMRKFVRRNRGKVAAAAAVAASLVAGIVAFAWQAGVARRERDDAVSARAAEAVERKRAEDVAALVMKVFEGISPESADGSGLPLRDQLVARAGDLAKELESFSGDALTRTKLQASFAAVLGSLGEYEKAEALARSALEARRAAVPGGDRETDDVAQTVAVMLNHMGRFDEALAVAEPLRAGRTAAGDPEYADDVDLTIGVIHDSAGRHDRAIAIYEAARDRAVAAGGPDTVTRLGVLHCLGAALRESGRNDEAIRVLSDVLERKRKLLGAEHTDTIFTANSLAVALMAAERFAEAEPIVRETNAYLARRYAPDHPMVLGSESNLASLIGRAGNGAEEVRMLAELRDRAAARYGAGSSESLRLAWGTVTALQRLGRQEESLRALEPILAPMTRVWGASHAIVSGARKLFVAECVRAGQAARATAALDALVAEVSARGGAESADALLLRSDRAVLGAETGGADAIADLAAVAALQEKALGPSHLHTLRSRRELGRIHFQKGDGASAVRVLEDVVRRRAEALGKDDTEILPAIGMLGAAYWSVARFDRSVPTLEEALRLEERLLGASHEDTLLTAANLAANYRDAGKPAALVDLLVVWFPRIAASKLREAFRWEVADAMVSACGAQDRLADAWPALEFMYETRKAALGPDDDEALRLGANLASCLWRAGKLDRSVPLFEDVVPRFRRIRGPDDPNTLMNEVNLAVNLRDAGRVDDALTQFAASVERARAAGPPAAAAASFAAREYAQTLAKAGRAGEAVAMVQELAASARNRLPEGSVALASELVACAVTLLDAGLHAQAEPLLRDVVAIRDRAAPGLWSTLNSRGLLGESLLGQGRFAEAEPLVVSGCEGLLDRAASVPALARHWIPKAKDRVLRLYAAWDAAEPGKGRDATLAAWREKLGDPAAGAK